MNSKQIQPISLEELLPEVTEDLKDFVLVQPSESGEEETKESHQEGRLISNLNH